MHTKFLILIFLTAVAAKKCKFDLIFEDIYDYFESEEDDSSEESTPATIPPPSTTTPPPPPPPPSTSPPTRPPSPPGDTTTPAPTPVPFSPSPPITLGSSTQGPTSLPPPSAASRMLRDSTTNNHRRRSTLRRRHLIRKSPEENTNEGRKFMKEAFPFKRFGNIHDGRRFVIHSDVDDDEDDVTESRGFRVNQNFDDLDMQERKFVIIEPSEMAGDETNVRVFVDDDLEDDPEELPKFLIDSLAVETRPIEKARKGHFNLADLMKPSKKNPMEVNELEDGRIIVFIDTPEMKTNKVAKKTKRPFLNSLLNLNKKKSTKTKPPMAMSENHEESRGNYYVYMPIQKKIYNRNHYDSSRRNFFNYRPLANTDRVANPPIRNTDYILNTKSAKNGNEKDPQHVYIHFDIKDSKKTSEETKNKPSSHFMLQEQNPRRPILLNHEEFSDIYKLIDQHEYFKTNQPSMDHVNLVKDHSIRESVKVDPVDHSEIRDVHEKIRSSIIKNPHVPMELHLEHHAHSEKNQDNTVQKLPFVHSNPQQFQKLPSVKPNHTIVEEKHKDEWPLVQILPFVDSTIHFHREKPHSSLENAPLTYTASPSSYHQTQSHHSNFPIHGPSIGHHSMNPEYHNEEHAMYVNSDHHEIDSQSPVHAPDVGPYHHGVSLYPEENDQFHRVQDLPLVEMINNYKGHHLEEHGMPVMQHETAILPDKPMVVINSTSLNKHAIKNVL